MPDTAEPTGAPADSLPPYRQPVAEVLARLGGDAVRGLPAEEARARVARYGRNELPAALPVPAWRRFLAQFHDVLTILLIVATVVSVVAWAIERETPVPGEALTIIAILVANAALGFAQESRAEQAVAALRAMTAPTARVLRDGAQQTVAAAELVPGDVLLLEEGDTIPADARVLRSISLRTAEAALTGESTLVSKDAAPLAGEAEIADRSNMVWSGTAVGAGRGRAVVTATGPATELGRIAGTLREAEDVETPLQRELDRVGKRLGAAVVFIAVAMSATILLTAKVRSASDLVSVLLLGVSLAVAAVPEGLTAITTIVLSLGTLRMTRRNVIVRKLSAVETLGSTTTICSDKTGTLTRNEMTVRAVVTASGEVDLTGAGYDPAGEVHRDGRPVKDPALLEELERTLSGGELASNAALVREGDRWAVLGDPTEGALVVAARKLGPRADARRARFPRCGEVPFTSERKLMSTAHEDAEDSGSALVLSKGAPDVLLARCADEQVGAATRPLTAERRAEILRDVERLGAAALRTLGVAYRTLGRDALAVEPLGEEIEAGLVWLGVVGMIDPPRAEARAAVAEARRAGIRPVMITGDHPITAAAIAAELGISARGEAALVGAELERMGDDDLREAVGRVSVYARVSPEHKLRIVRAMHADGQIAAMTGDGVNDAPALKAADIGVAMGITGTDVAKGASDMILLDDNFASIVAAVEEGRSIFANIQRFLLYLLSSNVGEVLVMFLGVVLASPLGLVPEEGSAVIVPLLATQLLWINLLTDAGPALALGVEPPDPEVMRRPPRDPTSGVLPGRMWRDVVLVGVVMAVATLVVMDWALPGGLVAGAGRTVEHARTLAFTTLVVAQIFNAFVSRFQERSAFHRPFANRWLWGACALSLALQILVLYVPFLQRAFHTVPLTAFDWLVCAAAGSAVLWTVELRKIVTRAAAGVR